MMAGGDDGTDKAARTLARRPTIRPRAVTPPRSATATTTATTTPTWKLPPVRLPSPRVHATGAARADARPVLLLVADASDQFEVARLHDEEASGSAHSAWRAPRAVALAASTVMVLVTAAVGVAWASRRPTEHVQTRAMSTRPAATTMTTTMAMTTTTTTTAIAATTAREPAAPSIPVFDVKSLPPAPRRK